MTAHTIKALNFESDRVEIVIATVSVLYFMAAVLCILIILILYIRGWCIGIMCSFVLRTPKDGDLIAETFRRGQYLCHF